ncbi:hypothetical protein [Shewanella acanthi]|uniref:hypothetical protein n=1 Tax=Shewanella acanthi TaxID=2864212 RepID=UPI001C660BD2|nr:hypothetical protein [Shewanella acanthi]QYJ77499.1 hypothetical protein K0H61_10070 [Shewanella acanthi]
MGHTQTLMSLISLMTEDAVFLLLGQVKNKVDFEKASQQSKGVGDPLLTLLSDIIEINVLGEWVFMRSHLIQYHVAKCSKFYQTHGS